MVSFISPYCGPGPSREAVRERSQLLLSLELEPAPEPDASPDQALQAVMAHREDEDVEAAQEAALHQRGRAGLHRLHSLHMAGGRDPSAAGRLVVAPPYSGEEAGQGRYDPALRLSAAKRRRLAQRAAVRVADGASENDEPVSPPWTR